MSRVVYLTIDMIRKKTLEELFEYLEVDKGEIDDYVCFSNLLLNDDVLKYRSEFSYEDPCVKILLLLSGFSHIELLGDVKKVIENKKLDINLNFDPKQFDYFSEVAIYSDWKVDLKQSLYDFNNLINLRNIKLKLNNKDYNEKQSLNEWSQIFNEKVNAFGYEVIFFEADWDSYCYTIVKTKNIDKLVDTFNDIFNNFDIYARSLGSSVELIEEEVSSETLLLDEKNSDEESDSSTSSYLQKLLKEVEQLAAEAEQYAREAEEAANEAEEAAEEADRLYEMYYGKK